MPRYCTVKNATPPSHHRGFSHADAHRTVHAAGTGSGSGTKVKASGSA
jgi:hypothetical protein